MRVRHIAAALLSAALLGTAAAQAADAGKRALVVQPTEEERSRIVEVMVHVPVAGSVASRDESELGVKMAMDAVLSLAADQFRDVPPANLMVAALDYREYPVSNGKLPVTLTAEVKAPAGQAAPQTFMVNAETGEAAGPLFDGASADLQVRVWTQKREFRDGEEMIIRVRGNRDFYGRLLYTDVQGNVVQVLPNKYRQDMLFKAETDYVVPSRDDRFRLLVAGPFGEETITLMASTQPLGDITTADAGNGMLIAQGDMEEIASKTRALKLQPVDSGQTPVAAEFIERQWAVTTRPR